MTDQLIDGKVIPYHNGRRENDSRLWRDATDLELEQAARIEELEHHIEELEGRADDLTDAYMSGFYDGIEKERKEFAAHAVDIARKAMKQEPVVCRHEWFRTEAMEPGVCRCIKCGVWNTPTAAQREFTDEIKALAEEAGFVTWNGERWNIDNYVVDWANQYDDELVKFYHLVKEKYDRQDKQ